MRQPKHKKLEEQLFFVVTLSKQCSKRHCSTIIISNFHGKSWRYFFLFKPMTSFFLWVSFHWSTGLDEAFEILCCKMLRFDVRYFVLSIEFSKFRNFYQTTHVSFCMAVPIKAQNKSLALVSRLEHLRSFHRIQVLGQKSYITLLVFVLRFVCLIINCFCKVRKLLEYVVEWDLRGSAGEVESILNTKMLSTNAKQEVFRWPCV